MSAHHASPFVGIPLACLLVFFGPSIEMLRAETTAAPIVLTREGRTQYLIELPVNPSASQVFAATELQKHLKQISSAFLPIRRHGVVGTVPPDS